MNFNGMTVPGSLVQIVNITKKDGSPLDPDNWRQKNIGMVTICTLAGGFKRLTPCFQAKVRMENGEVEDVDLHWIGNASTGADWPIEVEPGVYDFQTNTSIYRFRILTEEEEKKVRIALRVVAMDEIGRQIMAANPPAGADGGFPAS